MIDKYIIAIEGGDGAGKQTQTKMLVDLLNSLGLITSSMSFPDYGSESSYFVKQYLGGTYGEDPKLVDPYKASLCYAVDRMHYNETKLKELPQMIVSDRYTTSNMVFQTAKLETEEERRKFLGWLIDLEHRKIGLPEPNITFFLDVKPEISKRLREERTEKEGLKTGDSIDIHESNSAYMEECYNTGLWLSELLGWHIIKCYDENDKILPRELIHYQIASVVLGKLGGRK